MDRIISDAIRVVRYRFLLIAGIFPYLLGSAAAYGLTGTFHTPFFFIGLIGISFALLAVEYINEHFDSKVGTDTIFSPEQRPTPSYYRYVGFGALFFASLIALLLTLRRGLPIMLFSSIGAFAIIFYIGRPLRLSHRGLGELTIALAYGIFMTMGAFYLQAGSIDYSVLYPSFLAAFFILAITLVNEVPDYYQDKLVGKRNIVVRFGRLTTARIYSAMLILSYLVLTFEMVTGRLPELSRFIFLTVPLALWSISIAVKHYDNPKEFIPAIRITMALYLLAISILCIGYVLA